MRADARAFVVLGFDGLDAVLDETNGLIEAQAVISAAARGPMVLAWNRKMLDLSSPAKATKTKQRR